MTNQRDLGDDMKIEKERKIVKLMIELYYDKKLKHQFEDEKKRFNQIRKFSIGQVSFSR